MPKRPPTVYSPEQTGSFLAVAAGDRLAAWLKPAEGKALGDHFYVIDPLARWMERAPKGTSDRRIGRTRSRLGMVYARQGRVDLARTEFETALRLNAKDADAKEGLAKLGR